MDMGNCFWLCYSLPSTAYPGRYASGVPASAEEEWHGAGLRNSHCRCADFILPKTIGAVRVREGGDLVYGRGGAAHAASIIGTISDGSSALVLTEGCVRGVLPSPGGALTRPQDDSTWRRTDGGNQYRP